MSETRTQQPSRTLPRIAAISLLAFGLAGCAPGVRRGASDIAQVQSRDRVTWLAPRCAGVRSCLLGRVTASESASPLARAAVFLQLRTEDHGDGAKNAEGIRLQALTDDEGVFTIEDPPPGRYRIAVFKGARSAELRGVELGGAGTTLVPVVMAPN